MEKQPVSDGIIADYVKGPQSTAYANLWLDYASGSRIRCSVQCGHFVRWIQVSPEGTLDCIIRDSLNTPAGSRFSCEQIQNGLICVDGKRYSPRTKARDCIQFGSEITFTPTFQKPLPEPVLEEEEEEERSSMPASDERKENIGRTIQVNITSNDYQVMYNIEESLSKEEECFDAMKKHFSVWNVEIARKRECVELMHRNYWMWQNLSSSS